MLGGILLYLDSSGIDQLDCLTAKINARMDSMGGCALRWVWFGKRV